MPSQSNGAHGSGLLALAEDIVQQTQRIVKYLNSNNLEQPTFASDDATRPETLDYAKLQGELKRSLEDLQYLVEGPKRHFRNLACQGYELAAISVALDFDFFSIVPAEGKISLEELADRAGVDLDRTTRIVRLLATESIFREPTPGYVAHNPSSYLLHKDEEIRATLHYTLDEMFKAATATADNVKVSPKNYDSTVTPFTTRHGLPIFNFYEKDTQRSIRFAKAMAGWAKLNLNIDALKDSFPWGNLNGTVVDVGGGSGKVSITLAKTFPNLNFIVQDSADMHVAGQSLLTDDTRGRVTFMQHSFFDPQPVGDAAAFILRACALNWCDARVVDMFRALVPGLESSKPGTPLLINDMILPEQGVLTRDVERGMRQIDLIMLVGFGEI
ncbi:O-methyltransferase sol2 [Colletotrichum siamense]|uniref:O-methyltransferase sol2 n=1 Tax=Colletotrichum siamense TaxID=690259 RepID=UPI001872BDFF|nr:O-methyltransferase sol2 [Colletotrichum siamense]KAF5496807.1 O-methyltransferase sol2 [Colletotrichum siamense]